MPIRVVLVDHHKVLRAGLCHWLSSHADIELAGEADDLRSAIEVVQSAAPDVVVLDLILPDGHGLDLLPHVRPNARVLVFSAQQGRDMTDRVLDAGCWGFIDKTAEGDELVAAIRAVHAGRTVISVARRTDGVVLEPPHMIEKRERVDQSLSDREREVLACLARGLTNQEAADQLFLSVKTVETYRSRLTRKLGMRGRSELYQYAHSHGLLAESTGA